MLPECQIYRCSNRPDMISCKPVFLGTLQMFNHQGCIRIFAEFLQEYLVIQAAKPRPDLIEMYQCIRTEMNILCVTALHHRSEFLKTFTDYLSIAVVSLRTENQVCRVKMHRELFPVNCLDELQIRVGRIRVPPHS